MDSYPILPNANDKLNEKKVELINEAISLVSSMIAKSNLEKMNCFRNSNPFFCVEGTDEFVRMRKLSASNFWRFYCEDEFNLILQQSGWKYDIGIGRLSIVDNTEAKTTSKTNN